MFGQHIGTAIQELEEAKTKLEAYIAGLKSLAGSEQVGQAERRPRQFSEEARQRMREAAKKRWEARKAATQGTEQDTVEQEAPQQAQPVTRKRTKTASGTSN